MVIEPTYCNIINITSYLFLALHVCISSTFLHLENSSFGGRGSWWKKTRIVLWQGDDKKKRLFQQNDKCVIPLLISFLSKPMSRYCLKQCCCFSFFLTCSVCNHELNRHIAKTPKFRHVDFKTMQMKKKLIFTSEL